MIRAVATSGLRRLMFFLRCQTEAEATASQVCFGAFALTSLVAGTPNSIIMVIELPHRDHNFCVR